MASETVALLSPRVRLVALAYDEQDRQGNLFCLERQHPNRPKQWDVVSILDRTEARALVLDYFGPPAFKVIETISEPIISTSAERTKVGTQRPQSPQA